MSKQRTPFEQGRADHDRGMAARAPQTIRNVDDMIEWHKGYAEAKAQHEREQAEYQASEDQWRYLPGSYRKLHELGELIGETAAEKVQELIKELIDESRREGS